MFKVLLSSRAKKEFDNFEEKYRNRIARLFEILSFDPVPAKICDIRKLGGADDAFRIRIGRIRIVYSVVWQNKDIIIARIGLRENVYD